MNSSSLLFPVTVAMCLAPGCSTFESSRSLDMGPFADNTMTMFAEAQKVGRPVTWIHLKPYKDLPEVNEFRKVATPVIQGLRGVVMYSNQLVALNEAKVAESKKNEQLARYLGDAMQRVAVQGRLEELGLSRVATDSALNDVRLAETYLNGIAAASPIVNAVVASMSDRLEGLLTSNQTTIAAIERQIDIDFGGAKANYFDLYRMQTESIRSVALLYEAEHGNQVALDSLLREDPAISEFFPDPSKATFKQYRSAGEHLTDRLVKIASYRQQLDGERKAYQEKQRELEDLRVNVETRIRIARDAMAVWAQSHRNLGAGIPVPPLIDIVGIAGGLVGGAASKVIP